MFRKKKKVVKYQTNLTIYGIFKIKASEQSHVIVDGGIDPEYITITVSTGNTLYTIKIKSEDK
ncbi:hypothetical protein LCGC14_2620680 [marine sediment metagenome]|uniref:Uncharacterized protein n=1 Tax=marine sediment metagenome TaxID=412755 RepID=A0A0F9CE62_9ZZZZ